MRLTFTTIAIAAAVLAAPFAAQAFSTDIPANGLPSASNYSAAMLPERDGVISWKTLAEVEPVKRGGRLMPQFSDKILALDGKQVRVQGFVMPLDVGSAQRHFLISAVPPSCPFCMPAGPEAMVEVYARKPVKFSLEPIVVSGKMAVQKDPATSDAAGMLYRLTEADPI